MPQAVPADTTNVVRLHVRPPRAAPVEPTIELLYDPLPLAKSPALDLAMAIIASMSPEQRLQVRKTLFALAHKSGASVCPNEAYATLNSIEVALHGR